jgi:hypothetical protein
MSQMREGYGKPIFQSILKNKKVRLVDFTGLNRNP